MAKWESLITPKYLIKHSEVVGALLVNPTGVTVEIWESRSLFVLKGEVEDCRCICTDKSWCGIKFRQFLSTIMFKWGSRLEKDTVKPGSPCVSGTRGAFKITQNNVSTVLLHHIQKSTQKLLPVKAEHQADFVLHSVLTSASRVWVQSHLMHNERARREIKLCNCQFPSIPLSLPLCLKEAIWVSAGVRLGNKQTSMNLHLLVVSAKFVLYFRIYWQSSFGRDLSECSCVP